MIFKNIIKIANKIVGLDYFMFLFKMTLLIKGLKKVLTKKVFEDIYDFSIISVILDVNTNLVLLMMSLILKIDDI